MTRMVTKDCVPDNGESASWRAGLARERLEEREVKAGGGERRMMTVVVRDVL